MITFFLYTEFWQPLCDQNDQVVSLNTASQPHVKAFPDVIFCAGTYYKLKRNLKLETWDEMLLKSDDS